MSHFLLKAHASHLTQLSRSVLYEEFEPELYGINIVLHINRKRLEFLIPTEFIIIHTGRMTVVVGG